MIKQKLITLKNYPRGFHLITNIIENELQNLPEKGLLNILIQHTSAAITINENADPSVRVDMNNYFNKIVSDNTEYFTHTHEGLDDMPAHIKASIIGQTITIPITNYRLNLGTWQGIYFCEFRNYGGSRSLVLTVYS